jgi:cobalt-zinc-cadmium efflux system membrane fusion protein
MLSKELERQNTLYKEEAASKKTLEQIQSDFETTKAIRSALQAQLKLMNIDVTNLSADNMSSTISIYASENGYVAKVSANKGKYIKMEDEVMQIVNTNHIHAELQIFENDIVHVKENQEIKISIAQDKNNIYDATIALIGSVVNPLTKTVTVHAHFNNENSSLKPGMFLNAEILTGNEPVASLPETALVRENKNYFIFLKKGKGIYEKIPIEVYSKTDSLYAVILPSEIEKSNQIVLEGSTAINSVLLKEE